MSTTPALEAFLAELERSLKLYPGRRVDVLDEVRDHLLSKRERLVREGAAPDAALRTALADFGAAAELGRAYVAARSAVRSRWVFPLALTLGFSLAWIDSRPGWDDTGISVLSLILAGMWLGFLDPIRPWRWAAALGGWFPLLALVQHRNPAAAVALLFAAQGVLSGRVLRGWRVT